MKKPSRCLKKITSIKTIKPNSFSNVELLELDKLNHAIDLYKLYPEFAKHSNIEHLTFKDFYIELITGITTGKYLCYTIMKSSCNKVIGFFIFEKVFPFIVNAHIVIDPEHRNLYNAIYASKKVIDKLFKTEIKQIITYLKKENLNARILLKKLGFYVWGTDEKCVAYTLIKSKKKG